MRFLRSQPLIGILIVGLLSTSAGLQAESEAKALRKPIEFNREIRPILADNCFECHGPDSHSRKGDLRLDIAAEAHASAIVPGNADDSPLVDRILTHDPGDRMPPPESPRQPTKAQREKLIRWINEGANYDEHWAFVPPTKPELPKVTDPRWSRNGIDAFVQSLHETNSLNPQPDAEPGILARRLSLTLTGLPVLPKKLQEFEQAFRLNPDKTIGDWVDELLASPSFGEHLAWTWLDAGRYADTNGYQADGDRIMWPWRDWLIEALNSNLPFDQMTEQMLAGDLMADHQWESGDWIPDKKKSDLLLATGFLRNHRYDTGSGTIPAESKFENAADRLETVGTVWMGLTLQCARCHSHKFDPIEQREYYQLLSFFDKVPEFGSALRKASHPYIHTPNDAERDKLVDLKKVADSASNKLNEACRNLEPLQRAWERKLADGEIDPGPRVPRAMKFRFAKEPITFDGDLSITESNEPILLCAGSKEWTISFWFRPNSTRDSAIFSSVEEPERYRPGIQADWIDGKVRLRHVCRWVNSYIEFKSTERLEPNRWHHVTFRCDGRLQGLAYNASLNGSDAAMICTHEVTNDSANNSGKAPLVLGGSPLLPSFRGTIKDLRFYDRTLDSSEIALLSEIRHLSQIARIPVSQRNEFEIAVLRQAFIESDSLPGQVVQLRAEYFEARSALRAAVLATPTTMVMQNVETGSTHLHPTGGYDTRTEKVEPGTPEFLLELKDQNPDRQALAHWLTNPQHPLTSRVAVNRIWQFVWGRGFVESPENFGTQCAEPEFSQLLDWLAVEYAQSGWDTKALIKLIVSSRTYRQRSYAPDELWAIDPQNRLLARGPRFRLPIQTVRDQALSLSGRLNPEIGGPPVLIGEVKGKDGKPTKLPYKVNNHRRTIYTFWKRNAAHPMLAVFDVADRNQCDVRGRRTNTPLQALVTLNEPGLVDCAREFAKRARLFSENEAVQLQWAWQACTGRLPNEQEASRLASALHQYRDTTHNEDLAWTALCNVLLNMDATLSIE